ncbi:TetR/AcrR family transcriptional regulator [Motiliproteus sediminis]|uniref:TetR/AcrR family transcriptional regulator n=1 Tax=Motiliproteus sediminis TaxID=1468178 RepID=UPI001AEF48B5|nr:TetR/AcrR family transcriptional regulator [Motiliproteus sediminis]
MSDKRHQLVMTALELFYQKGVHAVGINEVLAASGVAKKTLYHHFDSKEALVLAALRYRDDSFLHWLTRRLQTAPAGSERIGALFDALDDWFNSRVDELLPFNGCFFINVSGEFGEVDHPLHQQCSQHKRNVAALIHAEVQALGITPSRVAPLTDALCLLKEGAISMAHVQGDLTAAVKAKHAAKQLITAHG